MNKCLYCGKPVKNKFCNVTCQNKVQNTLRKKKREIIQCCCEKCGEYFDFERIVGKDDIKRFCSSRCSHTSLIHSEETKEKLRQISLGRLYLYPNESYTNISYCEICGKVVKNNIRFCSMSCRHKDPLLRLVYIEAAKKGGRISAASQNRRSKNEIIFAELCSQHFVIRCNEPMFNGWDADIIIDDLKVAILWNGSWHYKEMGFNNHSLKQVQNRDKIKMGEMVKMGYTPYIIKDIGKNKKPFVLSEFQKFRDIYKF